MEIDLYSKLNTPMEAIDKMGEWFARSGMFGCQKEEQGKVLALACVTEGMSPFALKRKYHLLNGELSMRADAMIAELRSRGGKHKVVSRDENRAEVEVTFEGTTKSFSYTFEEAKLEPYLWVKDGNQTRLKKNWATPRARMQSLWARVVSDAVRTLAPEIVAGSYTPEEREDDEPAIPVADKAIKLPKEPKQAKEAVITVTPQGTVDTAPVVVDPGEPAPASADPAPPSPPPAAADPNEPASHDDIRQLMALVTTSDLENRAMAFFLDKGWLLKDQPITKLTKKRVQSVVAQADRWLRALDAYAV